MKKPGVISLMCVLAAIAMFIWGFNLQPPEPVVTENRYVLLIDNDTGAFLMQLRKGLQEAASSQGARVSVQNLSANVSVQAAEFSASGVTAVILLLVHPEPMLLALSEAGVPVVVVGQALNGQVCVMGDDGTAGLVLMDRALSMAVPSRVLVIADVEDSRSGARMESIQNHLSHDQLQTLFWNEDVSIPADVDVLVSLSRRSTRALADARASGLIPGNYTILGVDTGDNRALDLEGGLVSALVVDNPYAMGYIALEKARLLADGDLPPFLYVCEMPLIDRQNMYLIENVKLVFPLLQ